MALRTSVGRRLNNVERNMMLAEVLGMLSLDMSNMVAVPLGGRGSAGAIIRNMLSSGAAVIACKSDVVVISGQ